MKENEASEFSVLEREKIDSYNSIAYIQWHITDSCQEKCEHCYLGKMRTDDLSLTDCVAIINKAIMFAQNKNKPLFISFTGGDPLLYKHIWDLLNYCKDNGIGTTIKGNPYIILNDADCAKKLKKLGVISYQLSIDGLEKFHDRQRSVGSYAKALKAISILQKEAIITVVKMTIMPDNYEHIVPLVKIMDDIHVDYFGLSRIVCEGNACTSNIRNLSSSQWISAMKAFCSVTLRHTQKIYYDPLWIPFWNEFGYNCAQDGYDANRIDIQEGCAIWEDSLSIMPNGEARACSRISASGLGNLVKESFREIYDRLEKLRNSSITSCARCKYFYCCRGCRAVAYGYTGSFLGNDPGCWFNNDQGECNE